MMNERSYDKKANEAFINMAIDKIKQCKRAYDKAQKLEDELFAFLDDFICDDLESVNTTAPNADNLKDSITCYIGYGEWDIKSIKEKLEEIIPKSE